MHHAHYFLFISDTALSVWQRQAGQMHCSARYPADADGVAGFEHQLAAQPQALWSVLFDLQEEDCRIETLPPARGRDRLRLITRRLQQLYRHTPYHAALRLGRAETPKRHERLLFGAQTNPTPLALWLAPLQAQQARLVGLYSISLLGAQHLPRLPALPPHALLISQQADSGLRQLYLEQGQLRFSRLSHVASTEPALLAAQIQEEAAKARQYLASLRAIDAQAALTVCLLCEPGQERALQPHCQNTPLLEYRALPLPALAQALKLPAPAGTQGNTAFWLSLLAQGCPQHDFAPAALRMPYRAWRAGRALYLASAAALLLGLGLAYHDWRQAEQANQAERLVAQRLARVEGSQQALLHPRADEPSPANLLQLSRHYQHYLAEQPRLADSLLTVSQALLAHPEYQLDELIWSQDSPTSAAAEAGNADQTAHANMRGPHIELHGRLSAAAQRTQLALSQQIIASLRAAGYRVEARQLPLDLRPDQHLKLSSERADQTAGAHLQLQLNPSKPSGQGHAEAAP